MRTQTSVKDLVRFIDEEMKRQNLSGRELAKRSEMAHVTVNRMLSGEDVPSVETLEKIANALGYGVVAFLMLALKSHIGFEDAQLMETYQSLSPHDRETILMLARQLAAKDRQRS